jgi:hypothetical protein
MMIAPRGKKRGLISHALHELKPKHVAIKSDGAFQVRDFQVHMAHLYAGINRLGSLRF